MPAVELVPGCDEDVWELELPPKALFEFPPKDDDCEKPPELLVPELPKLDCELPNPEPPNAELEPDAEAEPFICPTVFAPGITPPPKLPPRVTPGSP